MMNTDILTHRLDSCEYFRNGDSGLKCANPRHTSAIPTCAIKKCKYYTPKKDKEKQYQ